MTRTTGLALAILLYFATGLLMVAPGEVAVVYRLGAVDRSVVSGLSLRLPWPIEWHEQVIVEEIRRVEPGRERLLTGDTNLVDLELAIQYSVSDPVLYSVAVKDPEELISDAVSAIAAERVAGMAVDSLLTDGRTRLQQEVRTRGQALLDSYGAGVRIASVEVLELVPPDVVVDAFNDVSSAQGDRETLSLAADAYTSQVLPEARGRRSELMEEARARSTELLARADGAIARFQALQGRYRESPQAIRMELRDALLEEKSGELNFMVVSPGTEVFLPEPSP